MIKKSILIWLSIVPLGILNGILREEVLTPLLGKDRSMPLSGILLCLFILLVAYLFIPRLGKGSVKQYILMGITWLVMTVGFEFAFGYFAMNKPIEELISAYNIGTGNLWLLVVLFTALVPWLSARMRKIV